MSFSVGYDAILVRDTISDEVLLPDSRLGNLGGHETFTPDGHPVFNKQFTIFGKVEIDSQT